MYSLLSRIPEGLDPLRTRFEEHVRKAGLNSIEKIADQGGETMVYNLMIYTYQNLLLIINLFYFRNQKHT